jgi:hypothetical protein
MADPILQLEKELEEDLDYLNVLEDDASTPADPTAASDDAVIVHAVHDVRQSIAQEKLASIESKMQDLLASLASAGIPEGPARTRLDKLYTNVLTLWKCPQYSDLPLSPVVKGFLTSTQSKIRLTYY